MALTIPNRFANAQTIDAAKFNSNFDAIVTWATLSEASVDAVEASVTTVSTTIAKHGQGAFSARSTDGADQAVTTGDYRTIEFSDTQTDTFDTDTWFLKSTDIYTPLVAGTYQFNANVQMLAASFTAGMTALVYLTKITGGTTTHYLIMSLTGAVRTGGSASFVINANGSTDTFKLPVVVSSNCSIDWAQFSGFCVHPS